MTKRIRQEDTKGNKKMIDIIKDGETVKVVKDLTPQQLAILNQKNDLKTHCSELGGYVHISYVKNELLFNELNLKLATITRLVFLATFIDYNNREANVLVKHGKNNKLEYLTRKDLQKLLNLSDTPFKEFLKETKEKGLLFCVNKKYYLSNEYFSKGKCLFNNKEYARIFVDTTRLLYSNSRPSQHKQLAYIFQLIPYLHYDSNVLCKNPEELDTRKLERLSLKEICELLGLGTSKETMKKFKKNLLSFHVEINNEIYYLFARVKLETYLKETDFFVVNPNIIRKGSNLNIKKEITNSLLIGF